MTTQLKQIEPLEASIRLRQIVIEAYKRRSRQLPANIAEIVDTLKADVLKYMPTVSVETIDEAIAFETLHDDKTQLSPAFLFSAIRKHYSPPYQQRDWDKDEYRRPDTELDTISLLDTCADTLRVQDERRMQSDDDSKPLKGCVELPCFNARREYAYLVMRGQLAENAAAHFFDEAILRVNLERLESRHHRLTREQAKNDPDVIARQKRLAVIDWLRACNTNAQKPSSVLTPLVNETEYQMLRMEV